MSHSGKNPGRSKRELPEEIETEPDAWERFEKTIGKIVPPRRAKKENVDKVGGQDKPDRPSRTSGVTQRF